MADSNLLFLESDLKMAGGVLEIPIRCTMVKIKNAVIMISPIDFSAAQLKQINEFGKPNVIVAPNLVHHLFLAASMQKFPDATVWGPPGLEEKENLKLDRIFGRDAWPYSEEVEALLIKGMPKFTEIVFFDRRSRTLIAADLCFNQLHPKGFLFGIVLRLFGTFKRFGVARFVKLFAKDRAAFRASLTQLFSWDFDRIVMAHGAIVESNGKPRLRHAFAERGLL